jgi:uncharacterized protein YceK
MSLRFLVATLALTISIGVLSGCSSQQAYDAIKQNQCREQTGNMYCDDVESYEDYTRKREELIK